MSVLGAMFSVLAATIAGAHTAEIAIQWAGPPAATALAIPTCKLTSTFNFHETAIDPTPL